MVPFCLQISKANTICSSRRARSLVGWPKATFLQPQAIISLKQDIAPTILENSSILRITDLLFADYTPPQAGKEKFQAKMNWSARGVKFTRLFTAYTSLVKKVVNMATSS